MQKSDVRVAGDNRNSVSIISIKIKIYYNTESLYLMSKYNDEKVDNFMEPKISQYGNHMVMTNVHKPMKIKYINIDTKFCDEYSNLKTANYNLSLPHRITEVNSIKILNVELPITFYNVSSDLGNNVFKIFGESDLKTITINNGQYLLIDTSFNSIFNEINTRLSSSGYSNVKIDVSNVCYTTITNKTSSAITINFDINNSGVDKNNFKSKMGWMLGFTQPSYIIPANVSLISENIIDLNQTRYLYLVFDEFNKGSQNSFISPLSTSLINKSIISKLSLNSQLYPFGSIQPLNQYLGLMSDQRVYTGKVDLQRFNIQLVNEYGLPINLNGKSFSFCIEVQHE
jgi:hypothetical protein